MKIKDILIKLKNQSIVESYEKKFDIVNNINELYIEKIIQKYSYTKEKIIQDNKNQTLNKKNKKHEKKPKKVSNYFFISGILSCILSIIVMFYKQDFNISEFIQLFFSYGSIIIVYYFIFNLCFGLHSGIKEGKTNEKILESSSNYLNSHYNSFYNKITFELIDELNLISDPEFQIEKENLKKYLIASAYELESQDSKEENHSKHTYIKQQATQRMFIDCEKPLENKTIMLESDKLQRQLDEQSMLKSLKLKFGYDKTVI